MRKWNCVVAIGIFLGSAGAWAGKVVAQEKRPTAREVVEEIKKHVGVAWHAETVDTFKAGDPETRVTGIAVTMMATMDVLQRAAARGDNLIITHEPTFYDHTDRPEGMSESDAVWKEKWEFIASHKLVVWRFHDHWHERRPDGIMQGMVRGLGWEPYQSSENAAMFTLPQTTLGKLAAEVAKKLNSPVVRVVGDPELKVTKIYFSPGAGGAEGEMKELGRDDVEVLLVGETREWETVEYAADAVSEGRKKALIVIGHVPSEQAGMEECARWLKTFVKDVRVDLVETKQPFWVAK